MMLDKIAIRDISEPLVSLPTTQQPMLPCFVVFLQSRSLERDPRTAQLVDYNIRMPQTSQNSNLSFSLTGACVCPRLAPCIYLLHSVVNPLRKLMFDPLESPDPKVAQALAKRKKEGGGTVSMR